MNQKELVEALVRVAESDAADNESKRDAEADLLRDSFVTFSHQHDFKPAMMSKKRPAVRCCARTTTGFRHTGMRDDEPLCDVETGNGIAGFKMPRDIVVGKADEDGDLIRL